MIRAPDLVANLVAANPSLTRPKIQFSIALLLLATSRKAHSAQMFRMELLVATNRAALAELVPACAGATRWYSHAVPNGGRSYLPPAQIRAQLFHVAIRTWRTEPLARCRQEQSAPAPKGAACRQIPQDSALTGLGFTPPAPPDKRRAFAAEIRVRAHRDAGAHQASRRTIVKMMGRLTASLLGEPALPAAHPASALRASESVRAAYPILLTPLWFVMSRSIIDRVAPRAHKGPAHAMEPEAASRRRRRQRQVLRQLRATL